LINSREILDFLVGFMAFYCISDLKKSMLYSDLSNALK